MTLPNPDISSKLAAPAKKSIFERQKAEAEAKKAREKAETAAALEDFVKSFEDEGDQPGFPPRRGGGDRTLGSNSNYGPGPGKRHFTGSGLKSGPGSLGPNPAAPKSGPGSLGPSLSFGKKRQFDEYSGGRDRERDRERDRRDRIFSYNDDRDKRGSSAFSREEEDSRDADELKAAAKPTLHLSSLPPGTSPAVVKGLFTPSPLVVENVRILPPAPGSVSDRKSVSAIVTLAAETPATDLDTMVSHLQNKYLGFGFNLSISRHLSSAALMGANSLSSNTTSAQLNSLPFGAKPILQHTSLSRAPPPGQGPGRFAPPASYTSSTPYGARQANQPPTQVAVQAPSDLKELRLIHKTIEALLTYGPEFEALLMSRPEIQRDEQWAWLWNSRSTGGVYYRWRLWEVLTNANSRRRRHHSSYGMRPQGDILFEGQSTWVPPEEHLKFEYTTKLEDFISDDDYDSSDEEDSEDGGGLARRYHDHQKLSGSAPDPTAESDGIGYLNPLAKTKLVHLLSRLAESNAKLRRGDVARITGFAIEHAGAGADEVAVLVTRNVIKPFCYNVKRPKAATSDDEANYREEDQANGKPQGDDEESKENAKDKDTTPASLVGLYIISDILSSSASAGVRHSWRYRSLFEIQLRQQKVFPILGRAANRYQWGKLKADKWRRSVQSILSLWEGWCVFPESSHAEFVEGFLHPPMTQREKEEKEKEQEQAQALEAAGRMDAKDNKPVNRWRSLDEAQAPSPLAQDDTRKTGADGDVEMDMDGTPLADDDGGEDAEHADDVDGNEFSDDLMDENIDGVSMADSSDAELDASAEAEADPENNAPSAAAGAATATGADEDEDTRPAPPGASSTSTPLLPVSDADREGAVAQDTMAPATADTPDVPEKSVDDMISTSAGQEKPQAPITTLQGRRARPRAADFDDMFE